MRSKGHQGKYSLLLLFVGIFAFWWGIAVLAQNNTSSQPVAQADTASVAAAEDEYIPANISGPITIAVKIKDKTVHTYSGSVPLLSPCEHLSTGLATSGSNTIHVTIPLTVMTPKNGCTEPSDGSTELPFSASLSVKPGVKVVFDGLTINGVIVQTNLKQVAMQ